jgi:hypothetical protein
MSLFNIMTVLGLTLFAAACCGYVFVKGGPGERYGAGIYGFVWVSVSAYEFLSGQAAPSVPMLGADLAIAFGFLILAVRYNSLWLGAAMIMQGAVFGLHVSRLTEANEPRLFGLHFYVLAMNVISVLILFVMVGAALNTQHRRKHPKHDDDYLWETAS